MALVLAASKQDVELTDTVIAGIKRKYPAKDVDGELLAMHLWLVRYPKRRPANVWRFVDNWLRRSPDVIRPAPLMHAWWTTDERTLNQGRAVGLQPRPGETMAQFRDRITERMRAA